jgi:hypothetical protein
VWATVLGGFLTVGARRFFDTLIAIDDHFLGRGRGFYQEKKSEM